MEQNIKQQRINVVDSLRGFAVVGIIIIHFLEHLNFYAFPNQRLLIRDCGILCSTLERARCMLSSHYCLD